MKHETHTSTLALADIIDIVHFGYWYVEYHRFVERLTSTMVNYYVVCQTYIRCSVGHAMRACLCARYVSWL